MRLGLLVVLASALQWTATSDAGAQQKVYKSVDEQGRVTYSSTPPKDAVETQSAIIESGPTHEQQRKAQQRAERLKQAAEAVPANEDPAQKNVKKPASKPVGELSLEELSARCEAARAEKLAPAKEQAIEECVRKQDKSRESCEHFFRDYGAGHGTRTGAFIPRKFHDLPECQEYQRAYNRRHER